MTQHVDDSLDIAAQSAMINSLWMRRLELAQTIRRRGTSIDALDSSSMLVPPHPPIPQERKISKHGMELSERGLPVTPWHSKRRISHSASTTFGAPEGNDAEEYGDLYDVDDYEPSDDPDDFHTG